MVIDLSDGYDCDCDANTFSVIHIQPEVSITSRYSIRSSMQDFYVLN